MHLNLRLVCGVLAWLFYTVPCAWLRQQQAMHSYTAVAAEALPAPGE
jgi:hypothetical protein